MLLYSTFNDYLIQFLSPRICKRRRLRQTQQLHAFVTSKAYTLASLVMEMEASAMDQFPWMTLQASSYLFHALNTMTTNDQSTLCCKVPSSRKPSTALPLANTAIKSFDKAKAAQPAIVIISHAHYHSDKRLRSPHLFPTLSDTDINAPCTHIPIAQTLEILRACTDYLRPLHACPLKFWQTHDS